MLGAAQWVMWPDECHYVYRQCQKVESVSGVREMWSMERWREWKRQFAFADGRGIGRWLDGRIVRCFFVRVAVQGMLDEVGSTWDSMGHKLYGI